MSLLALLKSARETYFSWTALKQHFNYGVPSARYSGYEAGRLARKKVLIKRVRAARERYERREAELDAFCEDEAARKAQARKRA